MEFRAAAKGRSLFRLAAAALLVALAIAPQIAVADAAGYPETRDRLTSLSDQVCDQVDGSLSRLPHSGYRDPYDENVVGSLLVPGSAGADLPELLQLQKAITKKANRTGAALDRWLMSSKAAKHHRWGDWAKTYQGIMRDSNATARQINFAKGIRGRFLDRRMNQWMRRTYGRQYPNMRLDQAVPGTGSNLRPDVFIPNIQGQSVIFDFGGISKIRGISSYEGMADVLIPVVPTPFF